MAIVPIRPRTPSVSVPGSGTTVITPDTTVDPLEGVMGSKLAGINGPIGGPAGTAETPRGIDDNEML